MFVTLIDTRFLSLHDAYQWDPNFVNSGIIKSAPVSSANFQEENIGQSDFCWKYISLNPGLFSPWTFLP